ncbi:Retrotransposon Copia-like N-terminal [Arabidopsis thaliana x Arabidopsis arenosa]|uniref:Retrotransposon Copia-like N-terminal n=1 Tax=Arabidopsis thaliana x Arabidopsis arenosa TaxID=1240361 RepID=A0A8T2A4T0_9BRAS|nr:Retrotransposon Copia-like N-terminal [Arabidopsis thaliana x Arabidopsis arenosa]
MTTSANGPFATIGEEIVTNTPTLYNINTANITKLNSTNYLMWSLQFYASLDGYKLAGYLDGSTVIPPPTLTVHYAVTVNPEFTFWKRQDKLLYSALLGAITPPVQPVVSRTTTSSQALETLASTFAKTSRSHIRQLCVQLKQWTKVCSRTYYPDR